MPPLAVEVPETAVFLVLDFDGGWTGIVTAFDRDFTLYATISQLTMTCRPNTHVLDVSAAAAFSDSLRDRRYLTMFNGSGRSRSRRLRGPASPPDACFSVLAV